MDPKTNQIIQQLKQNPAAVQQLLSSPDGQKLMQLLTRDGGGDLQKASQQASRGDTAQMTAMIRQIMQSQEGAALVQRIRQQVEK